MRTTTQLVLKTNDTLLCYFPNGNVVFEESKPYLVKKPPQSSDTCWFDGPIMLSSLRLENVRESPLVASIQKCKEETGAIFLLEYCYGEFVEQFDSNKLQLLIDNKNMLSINFPEDFKKRLTDAINSPKRKEILLEHLALAVKSGKEKGINSLKSRANKMRFETQYACLMEIGSEKEAINISNTNSLLQEDMKYCDLIQIQLKHCIVDKLLQFLTIEKCQPPSTPLEMFQFLEKVGPIIIKGYIGIDSYKSGTEKPLRTIQNIRIYGWDKENYIEDNGSLHATIIIGIKYDEKNPDLSRIYFLDPRQSMNPDDKYQQVYSVSFSKYMSKVKETYFLAGYNLTAEIRKILESNNSFKEDSKLNTKISTISVFKKNEGTRQKIASPNNELKTVKKI